MWQQGEVLHYSKTYQSSLGKRQAWLWNLNPSGVHRSLCREIQTKGRDLPFSSSGICGQGMRVAVAWRWQCQPHAQTPGSLKPESCPPSSLVTRRTDKDGAGYLDMVLGFSLLGTNGFCLCFAVETGLQSGESPIPPSSTIF